MEHSITLPAITQWNKSKSYENMALTKQKFNLKIFQIDKLHYELKDKSNEVIIELIRENHKKQLFALDSNLENVKPLLESYDEDEFRFYSYCYNQEKNQNYWKLFLPDPLVENHNFELYEFSFVLFIIYKTNIYCVIGGSGINVIKRYINPFFGIDLYQHFAKPHEDISLGISTRGVMGNVSQRTNTFNLNQTINDSLEYSEIPKKLKVIVRDELVNGIFKKYALEKNKAIMEIGSYFSLRKKISFEELKELIIDIHKIKLDKENYNQLTLFKKIENPTLLSELDKTLKKKMEDDVTLHSTPEHLNKLNNDIVEVVNFNKLEKFYECDRFKLHFKKTRKSKDREVTSRKELYKACTEHIYNSLDTITDKKAINSAFYDLNIVGIIDDKELTFGSLLNHITAEIPYLDKKYFRIDNQWFLLEGRFLSKVNEEAINYYKIHRLDDGILNIWQPEWDEDKYNLSHKLDNYYILDKRIKENIELCDILIIEDNTLYLIHVKDGFNAQMRDLYSQVTLSAKRLWNDLNNNTGSDYFIKTIEYYNSKNPSKTINAKELFSKILNAEIKIKFVMAYNNRAYKGQQPTEKINSSRSNIAKFCIGQTIRDMNNYKNFDFNIIDISGI